MNTIYLKPHKEESVLRYHPWIFSGAIAHIDGNPQEGELVLVKDSYGHKMGVGHYQIGSIAVRLLEFFTDTLPADFIQTRLQQALSVRQALQLITPNNSTFRLVHGEGDFLPGLIVDIYNDTAVIQAHSVGMHLWRHDIAQAIVQLLPSVRNVYYKSEGTLPFKAQLQDREDTYLIGGVSTCQALENGLTFGIDWLKGQKTGFFIDQRENRALVERYARNKDVLNMFCYTGGFSVYALRGGARKVHSVDSSAIAIEQVNRNVEYNFPDCNRHTAFTEDAFKFLDTTPDTYDLIILDPPAFAKHREAIRNALQGYKRLNAKAIERIRKGGILFTFSCSQVITKEMFRLAVFSAAAQTGRQVRILHQLTQPQDHPVNIYHPEGEYLKGLVLYIE